MVFVFATKTNCYLMSTGRFQCSLLACNYKHQIQTIVFLVEGTLAPAGPTGPGDPMVPRGPRSPRSPCGQMDTLQDEVLLTAYDGEILCCSFNGSARPPVVGGPATAFASKS